MIDFEPTEEQALVIETVRQFAENEIRPVSRSTDEAGAPPVTVLEAAHELGLVANGLPEAFGGGGERSAMTGALIAEELAWGDLAIALAILSPALVGYPVADFGSESQQEDVLPGLTGGSFVPGSLAVVEPRFDFDVFHPQTTAKRDGDEILLDGVKCQVPWLDGGRDVVVIAADEQGLAGFLVPRDAEGLRAEPEMMMGLCGLPTAQLTLAGVRLPASARLAAGDAEIRELIDRGRIALAAAGVGTARAAYELARDYAKERETFGQPIATRQSIAFKLADESGNVVFNHMENHSDSIIKGLKTISESTRRLARAYMDAGAHGIFYAIQMAGHPRFSKDLYDRFCRVDDMTILEEVKNRSKFSMIHLHGSEKVDFDTFLDLPLEALNWHDQIVGPSIADVRSKTSKVLVAGIPDHMGIVGMDNTKLSNLFVDALKNAGTTGIVLGPGCTVDHWAVTEEQLHFIRDWAEDYKDNS